MCFTKGAPLFQICISCPPGSASLIQIRIFAFCFAHEQVEPIAHIQLCLVGVTVFLVSGRRVRSRCLAPACTNTAFGFTASKNPDQQSTPRISRVKTCILGEIVEVFRRPPRSSDEVSSSSNHPTIRAAGCLRQHLSRRSKQRLWTIGYSRPVTARAVISTIGATFSELTLHHGCLQRHPGSQEAVHPRKARWERRHSESCNVAPRHRREHFFDREQAQDVSVLSSS
jgi:hypothetical protein